jgi:polysaccharide export outer membrane protein
MMKRIFITYAILVLAQACAFGQTPDDLAREYYKKGNIYYQQGMFKQAQDEYNKAMDVLKSRDSSVLQQPAVGQAPRPVEKQQAAASAGAPAVQLSSSTEYIIGDDDILKISVWQNPDLDQEAIVRPDGKISVPLIGDVMARGLSITMLDDDLTKRLSEYVRGPEVSISLNKIGGSKVILLGEISKPGVYSMAGQKTLLEAIGLAGGFTRDAVASSIVLIRGGLVDPHAQRINLSKALKGRDFIRQNVVLQAEDVVFVPKKFIADINYFLTQITAPLSQGSYISKEYQSW